MRALSVKRKWAELIVQGKKREEWRSWQTRHRGLLVIHASGKGGALVGVVEVVDVVGVPGEYAWQLRKARRFAVEIPARGRLMTWTLTPEQERAVRRALRNGAA